MAPDADLCIDRFVVALTWREGGQKPRRSEPRPSLRVEAHSEDENGPAGLRMCGEMASPDKLYDMQQV